MITKDFSILKEVITPTNISEMCELITLHQLSYLIGYYGSPVIDMQNKLCTDLCCKNILDYSFSESYDLVQEAGLVLIPYIGKHLSDILYLDRHGKKVTIQKLVQKRLTQIVYAKQLHSGDLSLDTIDERYLPIYEIDDNNKELDYDIEQKEVDRIIKSLKLTALQRKALICRMEGMTYTEIAKVIHRAISTTFDCIKSIQKKYLAIYG